MATEKDSKRIDELEKRVRIAEETIEQLAQGILTMSEHLPIVVRWMPDVKEALVIAREICERVASKRRESVPPPPEPRTSERRLQRALPLEPLDPRVHKTKKF